MITRDRIAATWTRVVGGRAADAPVQSNTVVPVIVVDDHSRGPYPVGRRWIVYRMFAASALIMAFNDSSYLPGAPVLCEEMSTGDNVTPANGTSGRRPLGSVGIQGLNNVGAAGVFQLDTNDAVQHDVFELHAELGPGQVAVFRAGTLNVGMTVTAWGRYYEPA